MCFALYSWVAEENLVIRGRALPFDGTDTVPLGFKTTTAGSFTIALDHVDGLFLGSQQIYLKDNLSQIIHDIKAGAYTFVAESGSFNDRFEIVYSSTLSTISNLDKRQQVIAYRNADALVIHSGVTALASIKVFDVQGRLLKQRKGINSLDVNIAAGWANGLLLIEVIDVNGFSCVKKVLW